MRLAHKSRPQLVQFQPNKLLRSWGGEDARLRFADAKADFGNLWERLRNFSTSWKLGNAQANLWEIGYVCPVPPGKLWHTPTDWSQVFPGLFPAGGANAVDHRWTTFTGEWYFEIPGQKGRVQVNVEKAVANQSQEIVLLMRLTARGEISDSGAADWSAGLDIGARSITRIFYDLASPEARKEWEERT
jgi:hypothetical protein